MNNYICFISKMNRISKVSHLRPPFSQAQREDLVAEFIAEGADVNAAVAANHFSGVMGDTR